MNQPAPHLADRMTHVRWIILALIAFASFVAYVLRTNMSVAGEPMMRDLGFTQLQLGMVLAAFTWGYAIFQFPGGLLTDWIGSRRGLTLIMVGWGIVNLLTGLIPSGSGPTVMLLTLMSLRFLMGAAQAPLFPIIGGATIRNWFPFAGWALPNALTNVGLTFGSAATGPIVAALTERVGWRGSFVVTAPAAFIIAAIWWWYGRDRPAEHGGVSQQELDLINANRPADTGAPGQPGDWKVVLKNRNVLLLTASYFCNNYVFYFFFNWLVIYLVEDRHFTLLKSGYFAAAPWITGAAGAFVGGLLCDGLTKRLGIRWGCRLPSMVGLVLAAGFILAAATATNAYVAVVFLSLCLASQQMTDSASWAATAAVSGKHAAAGCGVLNTGGNVVGGIVALVVPLTVRELGWVAAIATASIFAIVGAALWFWIEADRQLAS